MNKQQPIRVAINGFGRIGRVIARQLTLNPIFQLVAINDLVPADNLAYLFKYDTTHGKAKFDIDVIGSDVIQTSYVSEHEEFLGCKTVNHIKCLSIKDGKFPWKDLNIDLVFDCTGIYVTTETAKVHIDCGAKKVVIGAPAKDETPMFVYGVNHEEYKGQEIISMASCTTNCLAPIMKILDKEFGVKQALMATIHSITASQRNLDGPSKKDWRGGRACGESIIPSSTGAAKAVAKVLPNLKGKITGNSYRVPTKDASIVDLTVELNTDTTLSAVIDKLVIDGVLGNTHEELVSSDIIGNPLSSIVDVRSCIQLNARFFKLVSWYDNEWGYSARMIDTAKYIMNYKQ